MPIARLARNLLSGSRLALFLPVQRNDFHVGLRYAALGILTSIVLMGVVNYQQQDFEVFVNIYGVLALVILVFAIFLAALAYARSQGSLQHLPDLLTLWAFSSPILVIVIFVVLELFEESSVQRSIQIALLVWAVAVVNRGARLAFPDASTGSRSILGTALIGFSVAMSFVGLHPFLFYSWQSELYDDYVPVDQEEVYYRQPELMLGELGEIADGTPGVTDIYFIGFAGNGDETVFQSEATFAAAVVGENYGISDRTIVLSSDTDHLSTKPLANSYNLYAAIRYFGAKMNVAEDVLFVFLTLHGSQNATIDVSLFPFAFKPVSADGLKAALDDSGAMWRIIVVSACFSGSFIEALKDDRTAIFTASSADRTSFGCSSERELTYFGEAFFKDSLGHGKSLTESFDQALTLISERESAEGLGASNPQKFIGDLILPKLAELSVASENPTYVD